MASDVVAGARHDPFFCLLGRYAGTQVGPQEMSYIGQARYSPQGHYLSRLGDRNTRASARPERASTLQG